MNLQAACIANGPKCRAVGGSEMNQQTGALAPQGVNQQAMLQTTEQHNLVSQPNGNWRDNLASQSGQLGQSQAQRNGYAGFTSRRGGALGFFTRLRATRPVKWARELLGSPLATSYGQLALTAGLKDSANWVLRQGCLPLGELQAKLGSERSWIYLRCW